MKRLLFSLFLAAAVSLPLFAELPDLYELLLELTGGLPDANAGLTSFPVLRIPSGGRYSAMAATSTAMSGTPDFYDTNPAGTADLGGTRLSVLHRRWIADSTVETAAFGVDLGRIGLGTGIKLFHVPFTAYDESGNRVSTGRFIEAAAVANISYQFIWTAHLTAALGVNAKYLYRGVSSSLAAGQSAYSVPLDAGILVRFTFLDVSRRQRRNFAIGAVAKNLGPPVKAFGVPLPSLVSAGISYAPAPFITVAGDFVVPVNLGGPGSPAESMYGTAGLTLELTRFLAVHGGARIHPSDPAVALGTSIDLGLVAVDVVYSLSAVLGLDPLESIGVAATIRLGDRNDESE